MILSITSLRGAISTLQNHLQNRKPPLVAALGFLGDLSLYLWFSKAFLTSGHMHQLENIRLLTESVAAQQPERRG